MKVLHVSTVYNSWTLGGDVGYVCDSEVGRVMCSGCLPLWHFFPLSSLLILTFAPEHLMTFYPVNSKLEDTDFFIKHHLYITGSL